MNAIRGYSRLAPLIVVALMLIATGCSLEFNPQDSSQGSGSNQDTNTPAPSSSSGSSGEQVYGDGESSGQQLWGGLITELDNDGGETVEYNASTSIIPVSEMTEDMVGQSVGTISYDLGCSGTWNLESVNGNSVEVREHITQGLDNCVETTYVTLTPQSDSTLRYEGEETNGDRSVGSLTPGSGNISSTPAPGTPAQGQSRSGGQSHSSSSGGSKGSVKQGFEPFIGKWYSHGNNLTVRSDRTGRGVSRIYSTPSGEICSPDRSKCNVKFEVSFATATDGIVGKITSIKDGDYADLKVGDTFTLKFVDDNFLIANGSKRVGNPYLCNGQTSDENRPKCGA